MQEAVDNRILRPYDLTIYLPLQEAVDKGEAPACPESGCGGRYIPRMPSSPSGPDDAVRMSD